MILTVDKYNLLRKFLLSCFQAREVFPPVTIEGPGGAGLVREALESVSGWAVMTTSPTTEISEAAWEWATKLTHTEPRVLILGLDKLHTKKTAGVERFVRAVTKGKCAQMPALIAVITDPAPEYLHTYTTVLSLPEPPAGGLGPGFRSDARWEQARGTVISLLRAVVRKDRGVLTRGLGSFAEPEMHLLQLWCGEVLTEEWQHFRADSIAELVDPIVRKSFAYRVLRELDSAARPELFGRAVLTSMLESQ